MKSKIETRTAVLRVLGCCGAVAITSVSPVLAQKASVRSTQTKSQITLSEKLISAVKNKNLAQVKALLAQGANPNAKDKDATPVLFYSVAVEQIQLTQALLQKGANPNAQNREGATAIMGAIANAAILKLLLQHGGNPNVHFPKHKYRNDMSPPDGMTPLMTTAYIGLPDNMQLLLQHGARVDDGDENGWSALMWVAMSFANMRKPELSTRMAEFLIAKGASVDHRAKDGFTPLMLAAHNLTLPLAEVLLKHGANVNAQDEKGETALMKAVERADDAAMFSSAREGLLMIKLLLDKGSDAKLVSKDGFTALQQAEISNNQDILHLLRTGQIPIAPRHLPRPTQNIRNRMRRVIANLNRVGEYNWVSSTQVLLLRLRPIGKTQTFQTVWRRHDISTGREVDEKFLKSAGESISVSPDGHWAITSTEQHNPKQIYNSFLWNAISLTQPKVVKRTLSPKFVEQYSLNMVSGGEAHWSPDSKRWVYVPSGTLDSQVHAFVYHLDARPTQEITASTSRVNNSADSIIPQLLGITSNGNVLVHSDTDFGKPSTQHLLWSFAIGKSKTMAHKIPVTLPVKSKVECLLSPQASRLAWLLNVENETGTSWELWISQPDGKNWRAVGFLDLPSNQQAHPHSWQWLPDGKQLSFIMNDALYVVPDVVPVG